MAKDAKGHGSDGKGGSAKTAKPSAKGMRLISTHTDGPHSAKVYNNPEWGEKVVQFFRNGAYQPNADYHTDDAADAHSTAKVALARYSSQDATAAQSLKSGSAKSNPVPVHDAMARAPGQSDGSYITQRLTTNADKSTGMERQSGESDASYIRRRVS